MKRQRIRARLVALLLALLFLLLGVYGIWSVTHYGSRWFSYAANPRLVALKKNVTEGDILDRNGVVLATTDENGKRVFQSTASARSAVVHLIGDRRGMVGNSVESFHAGYLYGYNSSLRDAIYRLTHADAPRRGNDVTLTIDARLCEAIPAAFRSHSVTRDLNGAAVVMNYMTGELLALVSLPGFDPDNATEERIAALAQPYFNRATQGTYPPGSTFKIITAAAALEQLADAAQRSFTCTGTLPVTDSFAVRDFHQTAHGTLTLAKAFTHSCNVAFATLALELGNTALQKTAERFGFNQNFLFRDLVVENSAFPAGTQSAEALAATGYGQSALTVTPMHLCLIAAAVARGGVMPEPRLLHTVKSASGSTVLSLSSATVRTVCDAETAEALQRMMRDVVQGGGSGTRAAVTGMDIRGKTGTAETYVEKNKVNYGWFTGYNAQDELPFAVCVLVEDIPEGESGGTTAALVVQDIMQYLKNHGDLVR